MEAPAPTDPPVKVNVVMGSGKEYSGWVTAWTKNAIEQALAGDRNALRLRFFEDKELKTKIKEILVNPSAIESLEEVL